MGLSSYGNPKYYDMILNEIVDVKDDGSISLNMKYFAFTHDKVMTNQKFQICLEFLVELNLNVHLKYILTLALVHKKYLKKFY